MKSLYPPSPSLTPQASPGLPDLNSIDYSVPLQLIEGGVDTEQVRDGNDDGADISVHDTFSLMFGSQDQKQMFQCSVKIQSIHKMLRP